MKQLAKVAVNRLGRFDQAVARAVTDHRAEGIICGHIHRAAVCEMGSLLYTNAGDWVESCTALVENSAGQLGLVEWPDRSPLSAARLRRRNGPPMQICLVTDAWSPQINGVVTTLSRTAATLTAWGHRVLLLTPDRFRTLPCPTYPEIRLSLATTAAVSRLLADFAPDAVHIATEGPLGWAARSACRRLGLDFTTSYHTRFPEYLRLRLPVPLPFGYALVRRFHRPARRTMAAPTIIDELSARSFPHLAPWSRGVDTHLFRPRRRPTASRPRPVFVSVGRVAVEKNLPAFLDLALPGEKWVIGDGPALAGTCVGTTRRCASSGRSAGRNWPACWPRRTCSSFRAGPTPLAWCCSRPWPAACRWPPFR